MRRMATVTATSGLTTLDWDRLEDVHAVAGEALRELSEPEPLAAALERVKEDPDLLALCECRPWGDRIVLVDEPRSGVRVRLHRFNEQTSWPHSHRFTFVTRILRGGYGHLIYGDEKTFVEAVASSGRAVPVVARFEGAGASYAIHHSVVHSVSRGADTITLVAQGPSAQKRKVKLSPAGDVVWEGGAADEVEAVRARVAAAPDDVTRVVETLGRLGLVAR
jgi:hypothetical protein